MKFIRSSHIIIATSSLVLLGLSSSLIYWYANTVRPELIDSKMIKEKNEKKMEKINHSVEKLVSDSADMSRFGIVKDMKIIAKLPKTLDNGKVDEVPEDPVKKLFKLIQEKADKLLAKRENEKKSKTSEDSVENTVIESIQLPSELGKSKTLLKELQTDTKNKLTEPSNTVVISQVGLSLRTEKYFSAVYRIQNLFGVPGKVGHLFVAVGRDGIDHKFNLEASKINFGSEQDLSDSFSREFQIKKSEINGYIFHLFKNNDNFTKSEIESIMIPSSRHGQFINTYRWLFDCTDATSELQNTDVVMGLIYSEDESVQVSYPADVRLFDLNLMLQSDYALHSGGLKRILNHCRDYIPKAFITP